MAGMKSGKITDVTFVMREDMPVYPGDPGFELVPLSRVGSKPYAMSKMILSTHTGTHLDSPRHHFIGPGVWGVSDIPLELLCGPCLVVEAENGTTEITHAFLRSIVTMDSEPPIVKSGGRSFVTAESADFIRNGTNIRLIGTDGFSIECISDESYRAGYPIHKIFLAMPRPVIILETLNLAHVEPGNYNLVCLPLNIEGADGAPVRAILIR